MGHIRRTVGEGFGETGQTRERKQLNKPKSHCLEKIMYILEWTTWNTIDNFATSSVVGYQDENQQSLWIQVAFAFCLAPLLFCILNRRGNRSMLTSAHSKVLLASAKAAWVASQGFPLERKWNIVLLAIKFLFFSWALQSHQTREALVPTGGVRLQPHWNRYEKEVLSWL